jgi:DNA-binding PadR family transcriptional regulator
MYSKELLKGTLKTIILKQLEDNGKMYGYQITQKVKEQTAGVLELREGALYPTLHKLESDGLVITEKIFIGKRARKYYSLTPKGSLETSSKLEEFAGFVKMMQGLLGFPDLARQE